MIDIRSGRNLKDYPVLDDAGKTYIYVMLNSEGKIKIGRTCNIQQRYQSLSGSNSQGNQIIKVCCSPATYLSSIERIMHEKFDKYRISGTEWFYDKNGELTFDIVVDYLKQLFSMKGYKTCNKEREKYINQKKNKDDKDE